MPDVAHVTIAWILTSPTPGNVQHASFRNTGVVLLHTGGSSEHHMWKEYLQMCKGSDLAQSITRTDKLIAFGLKETVSVELSLKIN